MDVVYSSAHKVTKKSLIYVAELATRSQIESSYQIQDENHPHVQNFLAIIENLFYHGLKGDNTLVGRKKLRHPWNLIFQLSELTSFAHTSAVKLLDHLKTDFSKLRAWIKLSVVKCCLHTAMLDLVRQERKLVKYYHQDAILRSEEIFNIIHCLSGLENVQFNLDFKSETVNYPDIPPIDFSPFLSLKQSLETQLTGICECRDNENTNDRNKCVWRRGFEKLKQNHLYYTEQQHYHEELIQRQFIQLDKYREQLKQYKETTTNLQSYILQLQVELTLIHEQYEQELKRLGVKEPELSAPTFRNISSQFKQISDYNYNSNVKVIIAPHLNALTKSTHNPCVNNAGANLHIPSILSVDQGVDALSLEYSSNPDGNSYQASTVGYDPGESKRYRSVRFSGSSLKVDQDVPVLLERKVDSKRLPMPIRARSTSPSSSSSLYSSTNGSSIKQESKRIRSQFRSSILTRIRGQKSGVSVNMQEIPTERFILTDNSHSASPPHGSPKTLDNMTVTVKPRSHNLFSYYVPTMSTNDVEGIIRHVDSLMNPQTTANTTVSTQLTTTTTVTTATTSDSKTNSTTDRDQVITDNQNDEKSLCLSTIQPESGLLDSLTSSEIIETSSEYNSRERLHSTREYYHLTSEEDLESDNSSKQFDSDHHEKKVRVDGNVDSEIKKSENVEHNTSDSIMKNIETNHDTTVMLDTEQRSIKENI
ncbi:unnamed protein product [Trichobilharzia szidati]|nr:unnamed protein product [Trichobilharzia szidati]